MKYEDESLRDVEDYHLCYFHKLNRQTFAMNMISFGSQTFRTAKHIEELDILKRIYMNKTGINLLPEELEFVPEFVLSTITDWIKIIICFENFMKASLLLNGILIHEMNKDDKFLKRIGNQRKKPILLSDYRKTYNFSFNIEKRILCLEGITSKTLTMSTLLSKPYQKIIKLPQNILSTITEINRSRNNLHFYHKAMNSYGKDFFNQMDDLTSFVDNEMMNLKSHLEMNLKKAQKE